MERDGTNETPEMVKRAENTPIYANPKPAKPQVVLQSSNNNISISYSNINNAYKLYLIHETHDNRQIKFGKSN